MSEQREFNKGGIVVRPVKFTMERLGTCIDGHCLYRIDNGPPEHIIPLADIARGDFTQATCGKTTPAPESPDGREGAA